MKEGPLNSCWTPGPASKVSTDVKKWKETCGENVDSITEWFKSLTFDFILVDRMKGSRKKDMKLKLDTDVRMGDDEDMGGSSQGHHQR